MESVRRRPRSRRLRALAATALLGALAACSDAVQAPPEPVAVDLQVTLRSQLPLGGAMVRIEGELLAVEAVRGRIFRRDDPEATWIVLVAEAPGELGFRVRIPDARQRLRVSLVEAADGDDAPVATNRVALEVAE